MRSPGRCRRRRCRLIRTSQARARRAWLRPIRRTRRSRFPQANRPQRPRSKDRTEWLTRSHAKTLPADLSAPAFVDAWKTRALMVGAIFSVVAADPGVLPTDRWLDHVLRAWVLGMMLTFGFAVGGLALLMVQYCSGGKWGLLLRRPLEAMSRTLPLVFVYWWWLSSVMKRLYLWAQFTDVERHGSGAEGGNDQRDSGALPSTSSGPC